MRIAKDEYKHHLPPEIIVDSVCNSNARVVVAMRISKMGCATPVFAPPGERINADDYIQMLQQSFFPQMSMMAQKRGKSKWGFQQDNAPCHSTQKVLKTIKKHAKCEFPPWPPVSPDLSPLDFFLWPEMKRFILSLETPPKNEASIRAAVCLSASSIDQTKINQAIDSMIKRCEMCLQVGGLRFEYLL